jgi:hypothetical protein
MDRQVPGAQVEGGDRAQVLVHQGAVGHHRALGQRRGARCVEQLHECVAPLLLAVVRECRLQPGEERVVGVPQRQGPYAVGEPAVEVGVGQDEGASRLADDVGEIVAGQVLVDRNVDEARPGAGEEADQIGVRVVPVGADAIAGDQPLVEEDGGRAGDRLVEFRVRPGALAVVDRAPRGCPPGTAAQHPVNRTAVSRLHDT